MSTPATTPTPEPAAGLSTVARITNVFFSPSSTFTDLERKPSWWAAWLLISLMSLVFVFAMQQKVGFEQILENQMKSNPKSAEQFEKMTPDQRAIASKITAGVSYATPVIVLIFCLIFAGIYLGTFNFGLGTEIPFGVALAVVFYASIPGILKSILAVISLYAGADPETFNPNNPVATNIGYFISQADHPVLFTLGTFIDIFSIWTVILTGIGFACVSKVKRSTSIMLVACWYVLVALVFSGIAALRS
jgi:Yip1 domain